MSDPKIARQDPDKIPTSKKLPDNVPAKDEPITHQPQRQDAPRKVPFWAVSLMIGKTGLVFTTIVLMGFGGIDNEPPWNFKLDKDVAITYIASSLGGIAVIGTVSVIVQQVINAINDSKGPYRTKEDP